MASKRRKPWSYDSEAVSHQVVDYYMRQGYALLPSPSDDTGHFFGGPAYHSGAKCAVCKIPLLLICDLDCRPLRESTPKKLFRELDRLPLYYCWRCCAEKLSYQVVTPTKIRVFPHEGQPQGDDFPYEGFPIEFDRRPIKLAPLPYDLAKLFVLAQEMDSRWLTETDVESIRAGLNALRPEQMRRSRLCRHQLGGLPYLIQGHENWCCPNKQCVNYKAVQELHPAYMRELAVVHNDPYSGLPMVDPPGQKKRKYNPYVQVVFGVCEECLSISASNRCD